MNVCCLIVIVTGVSWTNVSQLGYREAATSHFTRCIELSYAHTLDVATECYNRCVSCVVRLAMT